MDILEKLEKQLNKGIETEAEASYLLIEIRKFLERLKRQKLMGDFEYLKFYCDWIAHPGLAGPTAQKVLKQFDEANVHLKTGIEMDQLPNGLQCEIKRLSKFRYFHEELSKFLTDNRLPAMTAKRHDGWAHFFHLYTKIIEDCPLVMSGKNMTATIDNVTVKFEFANQPLHGEMLYKIRWIVQDKNGLTGEIYIINSFTVDPQN
jgi:hypothetical protein